MFLRSVKHSVEYERKAQIGNSRHLGIIGVILIPGKRNHAILDLEFVAADDILLTVMLNRDIKCARMAVGSTKASR